jgi:hypothetical protein
VRVLSRRGQHPKIVKNVKSAGFSGVSWERT